MAATADPPPQRPAAAPAISGKLRYWVVASGRFASVQVAVQIVNFVTGILIIRKMAQREYAFYTIANTMQGTITLLADMGINSSVLALGGRVWQDRLRLGEVIQTAMRIRYWLASGAALVVAPILVWLLLRQGASLPYALLLLVIVLSTLGTLLSSSILTVVLRLQAELKRLQGIDLISGGTRFVLIGAIYLVSMNCSLVLLAASVTFLLQWFVLRKWAADSVDFNAAPTAENRSAMFRMIRSQAPIAIFYCFQGQLSIWLISTFGHASSVAEVGALGRLAMLFGVIGSVMTGIIVPRFARCQDPHLLLRRYFQILGATCLLGAGIFLATTLFTSQFLWLLGKNYVHLKAEFHLMVLSTILAFFTATMWSLNMARAWAQYSWAYIPATLAVQALLLLRLNVSTVQGVLLLGLFSQMPSVLVNIFLSWRGFREFHRISAAAPTFA